MSASPVDRPTPRRALPSGAPFKASLRRSALVMVVPVAVYGVVRPLVSSDALGLAIAAAIPILYSIVLAVARRRIDLFAAVSAVGFSIACVVSVLTGGGSLPLKLHEAFITFGIGLVLLIGVLVGRPLPVVRLLRSPYADRHTNGALGAIIGGFLVLHALLHVALAASLSTSSYLVAGRLVNWGTIGVGVLGLSVYRRRVQRMSTQP